MHISIKKLFSIGNPETKRRLKRFRQQRLARFSFWALSILYLVSLGAELVCNSDPLFLRFNGESYVPVFRYYPEDTFLGNGKLTRPDYKTMVNLPAFRDNPSNFMIFPLLKYGPYESVTPSDLVSGQEVSLVLSPVTRMATVNIRKDYTISRSASFGIFVDRDENDVRDMPVTTWIPVPENLKSAVSSRFGNTKQDAFECQLSLLDGLRIRVSLPAYEPRSAAPKTVRLNVREEKGPKQDAVTIFFDKGLNVKGQEPVIWQNLVRESRETLIEKLSLRYERPVDSLMLDIGQSLYRADFEKMDIRFPFPPVKDHFLGIDEAGRDVLARIIYGLRISLTFGLVLVICSMALGISAGAIQGYYGGLVDISAQRMIEIWNAMPFLYVMILMGSVYGRSFGLLLVCYGIFNWIGISYYVRAEFFRLRKLSFVEAAKCLGIPSRKIIFKHIMPNAMVPVITFFPFSLVGAIGSLAALDYLGFGLPPPTPSWGELLAQAQQYRWAWWLILYPSLALFIVMLLGVFIGEGLRNAYDPKQYARLE